MDLQKHRLWLYTQATSRFGFSAASKQRYLPILTDLILLILSRLRSTNFDSFEIAQNQILKWFGYTSNFCPVQSLERLKKQEYKKIHSNNYFWRTYDQKELDWIKLDFVHF